jgi:hypothetical protein
VKALGILDVIQGRCDGLNCGFPNLYAEALIPNVILLENETLKEVINIK